MPFRPAFLELTEEEFNQMIEAFHLQNKRLEDEQTSLIDFIIREEDYLSPQNEIDLIEEIKSNDRDYVARENYKSIQNALLEKIWSQKQDGGILRLTEEEFHLCQRMVLGAVGTLRLDAPTLNQKFLSLDLMREIAGADLVYVLIK